MNENPEIFKKQDLENVVKTLSNPKFYQIKTELPKGLNFFKKVPKNKIVSTMELEKFSRNFKISIDIENNLIILSDKFNDNRNIIFAELSHDGQSSQSLYSSVIKNMNPSLILIEQEPYQISKLTNRDDFINTDIEKFEEFDDLAKFRKFLKEHETEGLKLDMQIKNNNVYTRGNSSNDRLKYNLISEVESIIYNALSNFSLIPTRRKIVLIDVPYHNYSKSFLHSFCNSKNDLNQIKDNLSILNQLEIINWLSVQEKFGCHSCASFLNKSELEWSPMHLEFLFNKNTLPNSKFLDNYKSRKIKSCIDNIPKTESVLIFSSEILNLCNNYINYVNQIEKDNSSTNFEYEFDDYFQNNDLENDLYVDLLSLSAHLKGGYKKFGEIPPIRMNKINKQILKNYKLKFIENYENLYGLTGTNSKIQRIEVSDILKQLDDVDVANKSDDLINQLDEKNYQKSNKSLLFNKNKELKRDSLNKTCDPDKYLNSLINYKNNLI